jgi:hypothetical protein
MAGRARTLFAAGLLLAAQPLLCAAAAGQSATTAPPLADSFPFCAWWFETTATSLNIAFPDADAAYWTTPFLAASDLVSVTVSGQYEDARYFSLNAYNNAATSYTCGSANTPSDLADYLIAPDSGSQNPFQTDAPPGGRYTVTLARSGAGTPAQNTIPLYQYPGCQPAPSQSALPSTLSFLILRVYLPHDGFANVALPDLTLHYANGHSVALPQCRRTAPSGQAVAGTSATAAVERASDWGSALRQLLAAGHLIGAGAGGGVLPQPCRGSACPPDLTFFRASDSAAGGLFPNVDNKYISALVQPKPEAVVVIRAKAATFPPGMQALPWNPQATNLRYWSMCSNVYRRPYPVVVDNVAGQTILGCAPDLATTQDSEGFYTYVVSHVRDKPSDAALAANSATWLPFSETRPYARHLMILRNMLGADFPHSVQQCPQGDEPESIAACAVSMGAYYPQAAECRARTFETGGTAACFQEYRLAQTLPQADPADLQ